MIHSVIVDTGPLVALLARQERRHEWAVTAFSGFALPMATVEAVLTEAFFVVRGSPVAQMGLRGMLRRGLLELPLRFDEERAHILDLMERYADAPMSFADACLVRLAELSPGSHVWTMDAHFLFYRRRNGQALPVIMPPRA